MGHGQEMTHLAFVETDLPLVASNYSQRAARGQRTLQLLETEDLVCLHVLNEQRRCSPHELPGRSINTTY